MSLEQEIARSAELLGVKQEFLLGLPEDAIAPLLSALSTAQAFVNHSDRGGSDSRFHEVRAASAALSGSNVGTNQILRSIGRASAVQEEIGSIRVKIDSLRGAVEERKSRWLEWIAALGSSQEADIIVTRPGSTLRFSQLITLDPLQFKSLESDLLRRGLCNRTELQEAMLGLGDAAIVRIACELRTDAAGKVTLYRLGTRKVLTDACLVGVVKHSEDTASHLTFPIDYKPPYQVLTMILQDLEQDETPLQAKPEKGVVPREDIPIQLSLDGRKQESIPEKDRDCLSLRSGYLALILQDGEQLHCLQFGEQLSIQPKGSGAGASCAQHAESDTEPVQGARKSEETLQKTLQLLNREDPRYPRLQRLLTQVRADKELWNELRAAPALRGRLQELIGILLCSYQFDQAAALSEEVFGIPLTSFPEQLRDGLRSQIGQRLWRKLTGTQDFDLEHHLRFARYIANTCPEIMHEQEVQSAIQGFLSRQASLEGGRGRVQELAGALGVSLESWDETIVDQIASLVNSAPTPKRITNLCLNLGDRAKLGRNVDAGKVVTDLFLDSLARGHPTDTLAELVREAGNDPEDLAARVTAALQSFLDKSQEEYISLEALASTMTKCFGNQLCTLTKRPELKKVILTDIARLRFACEDEIFLSGEEFKTAAEI
ncbi:MAG: hypothetical protein DCC75_04525, partial [Proteobacteria bacterium]